MLQHLVPMLIQAYIIQSAILWQTYSAFCCRTRCCVNSLGPHLLHCISQDISHYLITQKLILGLYLTCGLKEENYQPIKKKQQKKTKTFFGSIFFPSRAFPGQSHSACCLCHRHAPWGWELIFYFKDGKPSIRQINFE